RPIRNGIRAIAHGFRLAIGRRYRTRVQVIASDNDRRFSLSAAHQFVEGQASFSALAVTEPANASRESLPRDPLLRHFDPAREVRVLREQTHDLVIRAVNVRWITRERYPPERPFALAEQRTNVGRDETGIIEGVLDSGVKSALAQIIPVIENDRSRFL